MLKSLQDKPLQPTEFMQRWPFFWISQINAAYTDAMERRMRLHGIDVPRWRALMSLDHGKYLSVSQIAFFSAQKLNTTTKVVQRMIQDGLVETRTSPNDGRVTEVFLTKSGETMRERAKEEAQAIYDLVLRDQTEGEIEALNAALSSLCERLRKL